MSHLTYAEAIVTGIVQGVAELFPISSLGHNVLFPALLGGQWAKDLNVTADKSPYLAFVVALHVATAFAMIVYFWHDWLRIVRGLVSSVKTRQIVTPDERLAWMIIAGTIPVGLVGLLLQKVVTSVFAQPMFTAFFLGVNGVILLYSERQKQLAGPDGAVDGAWDTDDRRDDRGRDDRGRGDRGLAARGSRRDSNGPDGGFWDDDRGDGRGRGRGRRRADADDQRFDDELFGSAPHFGQDPRYSQDPRSGGDQRRSGGRHGRPGPADREDFGQGRPGAYPDDRAAPHAPGFQPGPGQPGQPGPGGGYGNPSDDERTQVWNQQPGQQQWQGPDPRYGQDPRDPRYSDDPRYAADPRRGGDPRHDDPRYGQEPPAAGQGPAFTPSFSPPGATPQGPGFDPPAPGFDPRGGQDRRPPQDPRYGDDSRCQGDPRMAPPDPRDLRGGAAPGFPQDRPASVPGGAAPRFPQDRPASVPGGGAPSFTPSGSGQAPGAGPASTPGGRPAPSMGPGGAGQAPWENGPAGGGQWGPQDGRDRRSRGPRDFDRDDFRGDPTDTGTQVAGLPKYDENDENIAADLRLATMSFKQATLIGAWQIAALLPGISRDGIVTVGGMRSRLRRSDAVRFSFLLSAPVLLAAGVLKLPDLASPQANGIMGPVILGSILSFGGAYFSIRFLTKYFENESKSLKPFGYYCLAFGILSFLYLMVK